MWVTGRWKFSVAAPEQVNPDLDLVLFQLFSSILIYVNISVADFLL